MRILFSTQASLKGRGHVLMTKFDRFEKIRCSSFGSFRVKIEKMENTRKSKDQVYLKHQGRNKEETKAKKMNSKKSDVPTL
jgi:hypothetical protein